VSGAALRSVSRWSDAPGALFHSSAGPQARLQLALPYHFPIRLSQAQTAAAYTALGRSSAQWLTNTGHSPRKVALETNIPQPKTRGLPGEVAACDLECGPAQVHAGVAAEQWQTCT